jgi:CBS domain-containing protein
LGTLTDLLVTDVPVVKRGVLVRHAIDLLVEGRAGGVVRRVIAADRHPWVIMVESVMTEPMVSVDEGLPLDVAGRLMADRGIRHLGVTRKGRLAGWVTARSLIAASGVTSISVRSAMTKLLATIHLQETVREAANRMLEASIGLLLVGGRRTQHRPGQWSGAGHDDLAGILTESDLVSRVMAVDRYPYVTSVGDVMSPRPLTVDPDDSLTAAADLIVHRGVHHVVVTDGAEAVGVVSIRDLLPAIPAPGVSPQGPAR